ncbi:MAG: indolepyruvate ferredoxin oxidoreductase subunit alpha [Gammaproteobacteria bacterium]|nr:indolepyruvate ferredoxin oxidoreductase subunit alpha [Gammaproteobacteria bacterium]
MAERSFAKEVELLRLTAGEEFRGEGILAVTKALLQSGVAYVAGYQGAPVSHLMDVLADAGEILNELGVQFESSASEATAAATLAASINYPLRGAVTWKSTVGTNVASDALGNLASAGVKGGALVILGEDYGEGSSIMQERTHAFAMKSQLWLLDPKPRLDSIVTAVQQGFELSEASNTPVMLMLRIRACHLYGSFIASDNRRPPFTAADALDAPQRDPSRIILPPYTYEQEREKTEQRWPAAVRFIRENKLNEFIDGAESDLGIVLQGGLYNGVLRALEHLGLADAFGASRLPLYVLNATYPLVEEEFVRFATGKRALLIVEEGQPEHIEQAAHQFLRRADLQTRIVGKGPLPMAGEYTGAVLKEGIRAFVEEHGPRLLNPVTEQPLLPASQLAARVPERPSGLCTGCPERPLFSSLKLLQKEIGPVHVSADIGCHSFASLEPFHLGASILGYGLGSAAASALHTQGDRRPVSIMGDGGFWHNGLTSGIGNAVFNEHDGVTIIVDNGYAAATGGQWIPSSEADAPRRTARLSIADAVRGVGVRWVRSLNTYDMKGTLRILREAMSTREKGPKVIVAQGECQLNRQRRIRPLLNRRRKAGMRVARKHYGVDAETCTGDHSCIRLSGCPSLTVKPNPDPLRSAPVATVDYDCVGCGVCGEVAHAAVLCPSFYHAELVDNPGAVERFMQGLRRALIGFLQRRTQRKRALAW